MTVPPSRPRRYQNSWPNPARSLSFCAPGWRVTWPPRDPRIPAIPPPDPLTSTPRLARDSPVVRPLILVAETDIVAAAHAHRRDSPAHAEPFAVAPVDDAVVADTAGYRPSVSSAPSLQSENMLGTRCTAWNNPAASAALCRAPVLHLSRRAALLPVRCLTLGGSVYVSTPRVNFGERRRSLPSRRRMAPRPTALPSRLPLCHLPSELPQRGCLANASPFSCKPAAESAPRFYTNVPVAGLTAATALGGRR